MQATPTETDALPLARLCPDLERVLPRRPLCTLPTPVTRAAALERSAGTGPLFVKHDEASAQPYGGNKPRKLEWILGALQGSRQRVLTFGALGTNHGLATALYAARAGLRCELVLVAQPVDARVRRKLLLLAASGARLWYGKDVPRSALIALARLARHPGMRLVPTGGSSPRGIVGFVNAGLELAEQVASGALPEPERVYVAIGTGGSAAGLAAGLALGGLASRVVGVLVTDILPPSSRRLARGARRALRRVERAGAQRSLVRRARDARVEIEARFVGSGYAHPTRAGSNAVQCARNTTGLELDGTYTGKALAALLERERGQRGPILFWNTYAGDVSVGELGGAAQAPLLAAPPAVPSPELPDWRTLPRSFHRFFREES